MQNLCPTGAQNYPLYLQISNDTVGKYIKQKWFSWLSLTGSRDLRVVRWSPSPTTLLCNDTCNLKYLTEREYKRGSGREKLSSMYAIMSIIKCIDWYINSLLSYTHPHQVLKQDHGIIA